MARDEGHEELMREQLGDLRGLSEKPMFGGLAWLLHGHLLCAVRDDGALVRLGKGNDKAALAMPGVTPMMIRNRPMTGWVWVEPQVFADEEFTKTLIDGALAFVRSLPTKGLMP